MSLIKCIWQEEKKLGVITKIVHFRFSKNQTLDTIIMTEHISW
jgi:hypothetical protein